MMLVSKETTHLYFDEWSNLVLIATVNHSHEKHLYEACLDFCNEWVCKVKSKRAFSLYDGLTMTDFVDLNEFDVLNQPLLKVSRAWKKQAH